MTTHTPPANASPSGKFRALLKILCIAMCLLLVVAYASSSTLLRIGTDKMIWAIARHNSRSGISQVKAWYKDVQYVFPTSINWTGVGGSFRLKSSSLGERAFILKGKTATLEVADLFQGDLMFSLQSASLSSLQSLSNNRGDKFDRRSGTFLSGHVNLASLPLTNFFEDPTQSVRRAIDGLSEIATGDSSSIPYTFDGVFQIALAGKSFPCTLQIKATNTGHRLTIDESDLRRITNSLSATDYSEEEISLIKDFPLRAPLLLHIKQYAKNRANELGEIDPDLPVDPYRHVLWSYLLTQSFGESFAKQVTDAHEVRQEAIAGSDSYKDYQNNDMGRQYAIKGIPEQELASLVKSDPLVRR